MTKQLAIGTKVRVKNTKLYDGRVGVLKTTSSDPENFWDFNVLLEAAPVPEGTSKILSNIYGERIIGVMDTQVEPI